MKNFRVDFVESERGWGQDYWESFYDTYEEAKNAFIETNSRNTSTSAPDWYIMALGIFSFDEDNMKWKEISIDL